MMEQESQYNNCCDGTETNATELMSNFGNRWKLLKQYFYCIYYTMYGNMSQFVKLPSSNYVLTYMKRIE
jgi:hypothetical protein